MAPFDAARSLNHDPAEPRTVVGRLRTLPLNRAFKTMRTVRDIMKTDLIHVRTGTPVDDLIQLLDEEAISGVPVLDCRRPGSGAWFPGPT
jgi:CBS domain-containing protein